MTELEKKIDDTLKWIKIVNGLNSPIWKNHKIGDTYKMDDKSDLWKIAYYPIFQNGKTQEFYNEPRALIERPIKDGIDFREIPLRYLKKYNEQN